MADKKSEQLFPKQEIGRADGPVECLGMTFENDEVRREYFLEKLREKLQDPEFRKIEGFPIGEDEDILALSDPPYYTACPNPFLADFIECYGKPYDPEEPYHREPFAADVSEGKNDPIYNAHAYHTKVPYRAIMRYVLHYTDPGDIVLDAFCGTGMTGVAARMCADRSLVELLGYKADGDGIVYEQGSDPDDILPRRPISRLGARHAVLADLSPAATFIANNYNSPVDPDKFAREAEKFLEEAENECGWMFETLHSDKRTKGSINYTIWSDIFLCAECAGEVIFWEAAVDKAAGKVRKEFCCPHCGALQSKKGMKRSFVSLYDMELNRAIRQAKHVPVQILYSIGGHRFTKVPDTEDIDKLARIEKLPARHWFPTDRMLDGDECRRNDSIGLTNIHHFFTKRNRLALAAVLSRSRSSLSQWLVTGVLQRASKQHQIAISRIGGPKAGEGGATAGHRRGTLYVPSNQVEFNPFLLVRKRLEMTLKALRQMYPSKGCQFTETASATALRLADSSIDYIFTDPPFGGNIMYSELNSLWESVLRIRTNAGPEAVTSKTQGKGLMEYQTLMHACFREYFRVLKPGRWITVEFHNSQNSVWTAIQEALQKAGFVIADVRILDKKIKTHTQRTAGGSVNKDLAISAYKPDDELEERFELEVGTEEGIWDFIRTHLRQLPVFVAKDSQAEIIAERQNYLLFDRMVAFHVQRGVTVPISAGDFYGGLARRFPERDDMYFLPDQVAEYDKRRMTVKEVLQLQLIVSDEASAIQWLKQQLVKKPQTAGDLKPPAGSSSALYP